MWDDRKQQQLDALRRRELEGVLSAEERSSLEQLLHELEHDEWERLQPALRRLRAEQAELRQQCDQLRVQSTLLVVLLERQENLLTRSRAYLNELLREHELLKSEYEHITGQPLSRSS